MTTIIPGSGPVVIPGTPQVESVTLKPSASESAVLEIDRDSDRLRFKVNNEVIFQVDANGIFSEVAINHYVNGTHQALLGGGAASAEQTPIHLRLNDDVLNRVEVAADDTGGTGLAALVVPNQGVT